jgi:hypothetical protein
MGVGGVRLLHGEASGGGNKLCAVVLVVSGESPQGDTNGRRNEPFIDNAK